MYKQCQFKTELIEFLKLSVKTVENPFREKSTDFFCLYIIKKPTTIQRCVLGEKKGSRVKN